MPDLSDAIATAVSPSNLGSYAECPHRLVRDAQFPKPRDNQWAPYSDFGTVCHYMSQWLLGCAPTDPPSEEVIRSARTCPGVPTTEDNFNARVAKCSKRAVEVLELASPLPKGVHWVGEQKAYSKTLLPNRRGRHGEIKGYGGSIDVLRSDRYCLWDFKFVGENKIPPTGEMRPTWNGNKGTTNIGNNGVKNEYLYQIASYHIVTGVQRTGIIWTGRGGVASAWLEIDWTDERAMLFARQVRRFVEFIGFSNFADIAWPVRGDGCDYCPHKPECPAWAVAGAKDPAFKAAVARLGDWDDLLKHADANARPLPPIL